MDSKAIAEKNEFKYSKAETENAFKNGSNHTKFRNLTKKGDNFFIGGKQIIFAENTLTFLTELYDNPEMGFVGAYKLHQKIYPYFLGISRRDVETFLKNNETAQVHTPIKKVKVNRPVILSRPCTRWSADLTFLKKVNPQSITNTELKDSQVVLTIIDNFSKFAWARLIPNKTGAVVARELEKILNAEKPNTPTVMLTDNGSEFISDEWKAVLKKFGIKHLRTDTYSAQQNSINERFNRTIKMIIYKFLTQYNAQEITAEDLEKITSNYNGNKHGTTEAIPEILHYTDDPELVKIGAKFIKFSAKKKLAENEINFPKLRIGDIVRVAKSVSGEWRKSRQLKKYSYLTNWFYELYKVVEITRRSVKKNEMYKLLSPDGKLIDRFFLRQDLLKIDRNNLIQDLQRDEYVVEKILNKKTEEGTTLYLVKFKGYSSKFNEWIKPQDSFQVLIEAFEKEHTATAPPPVRKAAVRKAAAQPQSSPKPSQQASTTRKNPTRAARQTRPYTDG